MQSPFKPFSPKQQLAMRWWAMPQYQDYDAVICDGAVRSGKTVCMSLGFVCWATTCFQGTAFALCGKTITALRRNVVTPLLQTLKILGFCCTEKSSRNYVDIALGNRSNRFYLFGGRDESSAALIQGITLGGVSWMKLHLCANVCGAGIDGAAWHRQTLVYCNPDIHITGSIGSGFRKPRKNTPCICILPWRIILV